MPLLTSPSSCLTASANLREVDALVRGRRDRVPVEGPGAGRDRRRDPRARPSEPHRRRTRRSSSTPPLTSRRRRSGSRTGASCRSMSCSATRAIATTSSSRRRSSTRACARPTRCRRRRSRRRATSCRRTRSSRATSASISLHISASSLWHLPERDDGGGGARGQGAHGRLRERFGGDRDARARDPAPARARHDGRGDRRACRALP